MGFTLKSLTVAVVWSIATRSCMAMPIPSSISRRAIRDASYIPRQYLQGLPKLTTIADVASSNIAEPVSDDKWHLSSRKAVGDIDSGVNKDYIDYSSAGYFPRSSDEDTDNGRFAVPVDYRRNSQGRGSTSSVSDHINTGYAARYDGPLSPASDGKLLNLLPESLRKATRLILFRQPTFSIVALYSASESGFHKIRYLLSLNIDASNREIITFKNRHYRAAASLRSPSKLSSGTARSPAIITDETENAVRHHPD
ncbi:MAG: hypothetical protein M1815_001714 [Lichina confinis]|nr:MAG: hypothetical protein M1815_001714 [Lichina confinis]